MASGLTGALSASLSSLSDTSIKTQTVAGNIANSDVNGFKSYVVQSQSLVSSNSIVSGGVSPISMQLVDQQGTMQNTGTSMDLAIDGSGFYLVTNNIEVTGTPSDALFTRTASFKVDENGRYVDPSGRILLAWPLDSDANLPAANSLVSSLRSINVKDVISKASSTTTVDIALNLPSQEPVTGGGVSTFNIKNYGVTGSVADFAELTKTIITPNPLNSITKGEGIQVSVYNKSTKQNQVRQIAYDGFVETFSFSNAGTNLTAGAGGRLATDSFVINIGNVSHTVTRGTGTTNLDVMQHISDQVNATLGTFKATARIMSDGTNSVLYISPQDANYGMNMVSDATTFRNTLGLTTNTTDFVYDSKSELYGRFSSFYDLSLRLQKAGLTVNLFQDSGSNGAIMNISSSSAASITNWAPKGSSSDFLNEFGITSGFLQSDYNPYDETKNMAGGKYTANYSRDFQVYDSMGNQYNMLTSFLKIGTNEWAVEVKAQDPTQVNIVGRSDGLLQSGIVKFDGTGGLLSYSAFAKASKSNDIADPSAVIGATAGSTFVVNNESTSYTYTYGKNYAISGSYDPAGTTLTQNGGTRDTTDTLVLTAGSGNTLSIPRGAGATNQEVINNIINTINTGSTGFRAVLVESATIGQYQLKIFCEDLTDSVAFTGVDGGDGTSLATDLGITAANDIAANSFETPYELMELINTSTGTFAIKARMVTGETNGTFALSIAPTDATYSITFADTNPQIVNAPMGKGLSQPLYQAMGFSSTSSIPTISNLASDMTINWASTIGAEANIITVNYGNIGDVNGLTQLSGTFSVKTMKQNGVTAGNLDNISVDNDGTVTASFTNGQTRKIYRIPVGTVANPNGLTAVDGNAYKISKNSGPLNLTTAQSNGAGEVKSGFLENSNVDTAEELSQLIITQRKYQASTKVINIVDTLMDTLINRTFT